MAEGDSFWLNNVYRLCFHKENRKKSQSGATFIKIFEFLQYFR